MGRASVSIVLVRLTRLSTATADRISRRLALVLLIWDMGASRAAMEVCNLKKRPGPECAGRMKFADLLPSKGTVVIRR